MIGGLSALFEEFKECKIKLMTQIRNVLLSILADLRVEKIYIDKLTFF